MGGRLSRAGRMLLARVPHMLWACVATLLLVACEPEPFTPVLELETVAPRDVSAGDSVVVLGRGLPVGQAGVARFRGTLFRPGRPPLRRVVVELDGRVTEPGKFVAEFGQNAEELFAGESGGTRHTTFRGSLELSFRAARQGAPPLSGTLSSVVLDVLPESRSASAHSDGLEAIRAMTALGLAVEPTPLSTGGLRVRRVDDDSAAAKAGLSEGDVLLGFDGVCVHGPQDMVPGDGPTVGVELRREGDPTPRVLELNAGAYRPSLPRSYLGSLLFVAFGVLALCLFALPVSPFVASAEERLRATSLRHAPWLDAFFLALVLAGGPFAHHWSGRTVDGVFSLAALLAAYVAVHVVHRGDVRETIVALLLALAPASVAVGTAIVHGGLAFDLPARSQGPWPWEWLAFRAPAFGLGAIACFAPLSYFRGAPALKLAYAYWMASLLAVWLFGGAALPAPVARHGGALDMSTTRTWVLFGVGVVAVKTVALARLGLALARVFSTSKRTSAARWAVLGAWPAGAACMLHGFGTQFVSVPRPWVDATAHLAVAVVAALASYGAFLRVRSKSRPAAPVPRLNPFL